MQFNSGYPCKVFDAEGNLKHIIPHSAKPVDSFDKVTEQDLDDIINNTRGSNLGRPFNRWNRADKAKERLKDGHK